LAKVKPVKAPRRWRRYINASVLWQQKMGVVYKSEIPVGGLRGAACALPNSIDDQVAAAARCLVTTFAEALEARHIPAGEDRLTGTATGEAEAEAEAENGASPVLKRIHLRLQLHAPAAAQATVERVHRFYVTKCPIYKTLAPAVTVTSVLKFIPL